MQLAPPSPGTQQLPRVRGDAPATGLSMREIGMNPGRSARVLGAGETAAGAISAGSFCGVRILWGRGWAMADRVRAAVAGSLFGSGGIALPRTNVLRRCLHVKSFQN